MSWLSDDGGAFPHLREADERRDAARDLLHDPARVAPCLADVEEELPRVALEPGSHRVREELGPARHRARLPGALRRRRRLGAGLSIHEHRGDVDAGDAVDHGVVRLGDHGEAPVPEPLDEPQLPERFVAIELLREQPPREALELLFAARRGSAVWRTW